MSTNRATLDGHLGADPDIRTLPNGNRMASFRLATTETWKDKTTGEKMDRTQWHSVVCFSDWLADVVQKKLKKGSRVLVEGQIETRKYTDKSGVERWATEIVVRGGQTMIWPVDWPKSERGALAHTGDPRHTAGGTGQPETTGGRPSDFDDDIPF